MYHTRDLLDALAWQEPKLSQAELNQVLFGTQMAIAAAKAQYDRMIIYLSSL